MPALKRLPAEPTPEIAAPVARISPAADYAPRSSAPRELRELLEARLSAPAIGNTVAHKFSPIARLAIVTALAGLAWTPIATAAYIALGM